MSIRAAIVVWTHIVPTPLFSVAFLRRPAKHSLEYSRQNGRFRLRVIGHPDCGLPFGQDSLLLIWIAAMATWQKSRVICFRSAAAIIETFGLPDDLQGFQPCAAATPIARLLDTVKLLNRTLHGTLSPTSKRAFSPMICQNKFTLGVTPCRLTWYAILLARGQHHVPI